MKLVLFDFDGVLADTLLICFDINKGAQPDLSLEEYKSFFHGNIHAAIDSNKTRKMKIDNFDEQYSVRTRELRVPNEMIDVVKNLASDSNLAIISSTSTSLIKDILDTQNVSEYFKEILGSDVHKSKIVKIKMLIEKYKIQPADALYITDTVGDILEAREAGVRAIAVTWGFHSEETLRKAEPANVVSTPAELLQSIKEIQNV